MLKLYCGLLVNWSIAHYIYLSIFTGSLGVHKNINKLIRPLLNYYSVLKTVSQNEKTHSENLFNGSCPDYYT